MKRKKKIWTRLITMILAVSMVFSSQAVTVLADSLIVGGVTSGSSDEETDPLSGLEETQESEDSSEGDQESENSSEAAEESEGESETAQETDSSTYSSPEEMAEDYYGENAGTPVTVASVRISPDFSGTEVKAGETVNYVIRYTLNAAATYGYVNQAEPLHDTYDDTEIRLKLPEGLTIDTEAVVSGAAVSYDETAGEYVFTLDAASINAESASSGSFSIPVTVEGNGSLEIGHLFDLDGSEDYLTITTNFTVKDKTDEENIQDVKTYTQTNTSSSALASLTSATDDVWGIEKSHVSSTVSEDNGTITLRFLLKVGLTDSDGTVISDPEVYGRVGRVPFADGNISLTEALELQDREGNAIDPDSITVTENFGQGSSYTFTEGEAVSVNTDTCGAHSLSGVDGAAPYYSEYYADVVYDYDPFIAQYYEENQELLTVGNTASLQYTLKGGEADADEASASVQAGEVTEPAMLTIRKYIQENGASGTGELYAYSEDGWGDITGAAEFTITDSSGNPAVLYTMNEDGTYTVLSRNGTVSIDPSQEEEDGTATVYLDPGTYTIAETAAPENTVSQTEPQEKELTAGGSAAADFINEEVLGTVRIEKSGMVNGITSGLNGAVFGLYAGTDPDCEGEPLRTGTTAASGSADGILEFEHLAAGTYYVKEIEAPSGYIADDTIWTVVIQADSDNTVTVTAAGNEDTSVTDRVESVNDSNTAYLRLQKQYYWFATATSQSGWQDVNSGNYRQFNGSFTLQRTTDPSQGDWETVASGLSLNQDGTYLSGALPVYSDKGEVYYYRFREVLPQEWHGEGETTETEADGTTVRVMYSSAVSLEGKLGHASSDPVEVTMQNTQNGTLILTKKFTSVSSQGSKTTAAADEDSTASFDLYQEVDGVFSKVNEDSYTTDANGQITVTDLPVLSGGETVNYYWVETDASGYLLESSGNNVEEITVDGETLTAVGPFNFLTGSATGADLNQSVAVTNVEQKVPVRIQKTDSNTDSYLAGASVTIYRGTVAEENIVSGYDNVSVPEGGLTAVLETGYQYIIVETGVPEHYSKGENITVDLRNTTVTSTSVDLIEETLENEADPSVRIIKTRLNADGSVTTLAGTEFEVYTKNEQGEFVQVTDEDREPVILTAGTALYLDAGTYYLHEIVTDSMNVLDPDEYETLYSSLSHEYVSDGEGGGTFFFGPYTVTDTTALQDLGTIQNISSLGSVQVTKTDEDGNGLAGAVLEIYYIDDQGEEHTAGTAETPDSGVVTFSGLEIYDEDGALIEYHIREKQTPEGYYSDGTELTTTLVPGEIVQTVNGAESGVALTLTNKEETTFTVKKVYYDVWEHSFTGTELSLQGAVIALYKQQEDGSYTLVDTASTDVLGQVTFEGLTDEEDDVYVAVEYSIPDTDENIEPAKGRYLAEDYPDGAPQTLSADALETYNYTERTGTGVHTLTNVINWTQLRIYKYKMTYEDGVDPDQPQGAEETEETPQNHATFRLYKQVLPEDTAADAVLTFDEENCTLVGTYSSGTLADENGDGRDGWFATDILEVGDNIVYWLVETNAGPGASIIEEENYILFKRADMDYTNASNGGVSDRVEDYPENAYGEYEVENEAEYGPGEDHIAAIRLSKWAGSLTEEGEKSYESYEPLGGARYELWVANEDGELLDKIQDLTMGLESDPNLEEGGLTSYVISDTLYYEDDEYGKYEDYEGNVAWYDEDADVYYVRMAIRETYAPEGYQMDSRTYYLIVGFGATGNELVYNDAYFVADGTTQADLAEDQDQTEGIVWAESGDSYRLVNWPEDNFSVTVNKYGYLPTEDTLNLTSEELEEEAEQGNLTRQPLSGVTMKLQRKDSDGTWRDFDYETLSWGTKTFTTQASGSYTFPNGLETGEYRIIELSVPSSYEALYDGRSIDGETAAMYFEVTNQSATVNMYNPEKISLEIRKENLEGEAVSGLTFSLTRKNSASAAYTADTNASGTAAFYHISSGTYSLSESSGAYSTLYLEEYLEKYYPQLAAFGDSSEGILLGYTRGMKDGQAVVTEITDLSDYGVDEEDGLVISDPPLVSLTVKKVDENGTALQGAAFSVYYRPFDAFEGEQTVSTDYQDAERQTGTTDGNGEISLTGLDPGIYYIVEDTAPDGYDKDADDTQILVITGGMDITIENQEDVDQIVTEGTADQVTFENISRASLSIRKTVDTGELAAPEEYSFTFRIYDSQNAEEPIDTVTITNETADGRAVFQETLSRGETYYLEEADSTGYKTGSLTVNGTAVQAEENGRYPVTVPEKGDVEIQVTNTYLYARVTVLKVNGSTGEELSGASFQLQYEDGTEVPSAMVSWSYEGAGRYTAFVRLDPERLEEGEESISYRIVETLAPDGYLASEDPIRITLSPGQSLTSETWNSGMTDEEMLDALIMPNYNGVTFTITKYDNMRQGSASLQSGVTFRLYTWREDEGTGEGHYEHLTSAVTVDGTAVFTVPDGYIYAVAEEEVPDGYVGLQGIWSVSGDTETEITDIVQTEDGVTLYVLGSGEDFTAGETYAFNAYNIPELELEVRKQDASGSAAVPEARVSVYEVPEGTGQELTQEEVEALAVEENRIAAADTAKDGDGYSYVDGITIEPGKTYLILEEEVTAGYDTMILDDNRTVWYQVLAVPAGTTEKQVVTLQNVEGGASLSLEKTSSVSEELPSLFEEGTEITYMLDASIANTYGLDSYTLTDTGLTAYHDGQDEPLDFDTYLKEQYSITQVTLEQAAHTISMYDSASGAPSSSVIYARVSFLDFDGNTAYETEVTVSDGGKTVAVPQEVTSKIAQVSVEYYSQGLENTAGYALGQNFDPGSVTVTVSIDQQSGGADRLSIDRIVNHAQAELTYREWSSTGVQAEEESRILLKDEDEAANTFGEEEAPSAKVTKTADRQWRSGTA